MNNKTENIKYAALSLLEIGNGALLGGAIFTACKCLTYHDFSGIENEFYTGMLAGGLIATYFRAIHN